MPSQTTVLEEDLAACAIKNRVNFYGDVGYYGDELVFQRMEESHEARKSLYQDDSRLLSPSCKLETRSAGQGDSVCIWYASYANATGYCAIVYWISCRSQR